LVTEGVVGVGCGDVAMSSGVVEGTDDVLGSGVVVTTGGGTGLNTMNHTPPMTSNAATSSTSNL
jgi:hypothetical protein